jgi:hypothetical protein
LYFNFVEHPEHHQQDSVVILGRAVLLLLSGLSLLPEISKKMGAEQSREVNDSAGGGLEGVLKDIGLIYFPDPEQEAEEEYAPVDPKDATDMWNVAEVSSVHVYLV